MEQQALRALIAGGERLDVEFKRASGSGSINDRGIVEAVVCLANGGGGALLLGVENDGTVTGVAPRHASTTDPALLGALIVNHTEPPTGVAVEMVELEEGAVAVVRVPAGPTPVSTKEGLFKRRSLRIDGAPECVAYRPHELISAGFSMSGRDYASVPVAGVAIADLDQDEFRRYRALCSRGRGDRSLRTASDVEILRALRLLSDSQAVTYGALLLFGRSEDLARHVPSAEVVFQELHRERIVADLGYRLPLLAAAERLRELLENRNPEQEVVVGLQRIAVPRIAGLAIRELVANALVHRDYTEVGPIRVQLTDDALRIGSPGGFPPGITMQNLMDESRPRSVILADAFKRAGIVDRGGRGIPNVFEASIRAGRDGPDYTGTTSRSVSVRLPTSDADLEMVRFVVAYENDRQAPLSLAQLRVLFELKDVGPSSIPELTDALQVDDGLIRSTAARLAEAGLVQVRGNGRNRRLHLSSGFARTAAARQGHVRVLRPDEIQMQRMILEYADAYGAVTRAQAAELCLVDPLEARRLLARLVTSGELELRGERRGAHYVRSTP